MEKLRQGGAVLDKSPRPLRPTGLFLQVPFLIPCWCGQLQACSISPSHFPLLGIISMGTALCTARLPPTQSSSLSLGHRTVPGTRRGLISACGRRVPLLPFTFCGPVTRCPVPTAQTRFPASTGRLALSAQWRLRVSWSLRTTS